MHADLLKIIDGLRSENNEMKSKLQRSNKENEALKTTAIQLKEQEKVMGHDTTIAGGSEKAFEEVTNATSRKLMTKTQTGSSGNCRQNDVEGEVRVSVEMITKAMGSENTWSIVYHTCYKLRTHPVLRVIDLFNDQYQRKTSKYSNMHTKTVRTDFDLQKL